MVSGMHMPATLVSGAVLDRHFVHGRRVGNKSHPMINSPALARIFHEAGESPDFSFWRGSFGMASPVFPPAGSDWLSAKKFFGISGQRA